MEKLTTLLLSAMLLVSIMNGFLDTLNRWFNPFYGASSAPFIPQSVVASSQLSSTINVQPSNTAGGSAQLRRPSVQGASTSSNPFQQYSQPAGPQRPASTLPQTGGSSRPASQPQVQQPQQPSYEDLLRRQYEDQLNSANRAYDERAAALRNQLGDLDRQKGSLLDQISGAYTSTRQQAQDTLAKNLAALESSKGEVRQGYADQRTEQSRLLGDTQLRNRNVARALGSLNSSFYENLQSKANATTQANVSKIAQTEQSQLDKIGQEITNQNLDANTKIQALNEAEAAAKTDVINQYQALWNQIQSQLSFNDRGRLEAVQAIGNQLQGSLDQISYTMSQYRGRAAGLGGVTNPLRDLTGKNGLIDQLASIRTNITEPIQQENILAQAQQDLNSGAKGYDDIVGYLGRYDQAYGTRLLPQFELSVTNAGTQGGFQLPFGLGRIGGNPQYRVMNPGQVVNPQSVLDSLLVR